MNYLIAAAASVALLAPGAALAQVAAGAVPNSFDRPAQAAPQPALTEPLVRVNSDPWITPGWPAEAFWDDYAAYYRRIAAAGLLSAPA